jgi:hypothetical protein
MAKDFRELNAAPVGLYGAKMATALELWEKDKAVGVMALFVSPVEKAR